MTSRRLICTCAVMLWASARVWAQAPEPSLSSQGSASMEKMPELMRMQVSISAADADIEQALAKLKQKQESAIKKLEELGTAKSVITVEPPTLTPDPAETALRRMRMMRGEMEEEEEEGEAKPAKVNVSLTLKAEWPLDAADPEAMLVAVHTL